MDPFDLLPLVPPDLPWERSDALTPAQRLAAGISTVLPPGASFLLVLLSGFAARASIALVVLPVVGGTVVFLVGRLLATPIAWAMVIAISCAAFCALGDVCALFLHGLAQFFHDF